MPRTPHRPKPNASIIAAASRVPLHSKREAKAALGPKPGWQEEAWGYFDAVPEVKHAVWFVGNNLGKLRLFVAARNPDDGRPVPAKDVQGLPPGLVAQAEMELSRITADLGGQAEILREASMNLDVAGECFLIGWGPRAVVDDRGAPVLDGQGQPTFTPERWEIRSVSEVVPGDGDDQPIKVHDAPGDKGRPLIRDVDTCIRIWQRHPRWSNLADAHMAGVLGECAALVSLHNLLLSNTRARHAVGMFTVPNELSFGAAAAGDDDDDGDPLVDEIHQTFTEAADNPDDPAATAPTVLRGPGAYLTDEYVRHVEVVPDRTEQIETKITGRVQRLARGLNLPVEVTMGLESTTFANAAQVDQDKFDDYLEPRAILLVEGLTYGFLWPQLLDAGIDLTTSRKVFVWFDPSEVVTQPDLSQDADEAFDRGAISDEAYRRVKRFRESDAPQGNASIATAERLATMAQKLYLAVDTVITADEARQIMEAAGATLPGPAPVPTDAPPASAPATIAATVHALTAAATNPGRLLMDLDRDLRTRLLVAADTAVNRALERAGNRLRSRSEHRAVLRNVPAHLAAATLGQDAVAAAGGEAALLDEAFVAMRQAFLSWGGSAQDEALNLVGSIVGGFSTTERDALKLRQAGDLDTAWVWLEDTLRSLTAARLYDPLVGLDTVGEALDGLSVPPGMIREAIARAGGAAGIETLGQDAWVTVADGGTRPVGGIGTGDLLRDVLRSHGVLTEAYRWVYGPAARSRPFEPHRALDGKTFATFDDPVLTNASGWPPFGFYMPGDHKGCVCDVEPVLIAPDGTIRQDY